MDKKLFTNTFLKLVDIYASAPEYVETPDKNRLFLARNFSRLSVSFWAMFFAGIFSIQDTQNSNRCSNKLYPKKNNNRWFLK